MRPDIAKVICERERRCSSEGSLRTARKLNAKLDWESGDYDWGPIRASSSRRRQEGHGRYHKSLSHNSRALHQFVGRNVGRPWDDVYSEICQTADSRSYDGWNLRRTLDWIVERRIHMVDGIPYSLRWSWREYDGYYVHPETGILCKNERSPYVRPKAPVTSLHWYGNVWFILLKHERPAVPCGCVHFKHPIVSEKVPSWRWSRRYDDPAVCIHGNEASHESIWYVVEYTYHDPDEVYEAYYYETCDEYRRRIYGLKAPGDSYIRYYRDVPKILEKPIETRKKTANRKELRLIQTALAAQ